MTVYRVQCLETGRVYIGATKDFRRREKQHRQDLANNIHRNPDLQSDYNHYGETQFTINVIEICQMHEADEREQFWIDYYGGVESTSVYNLRGAGLAGSPSTASNKRNSESNKGKTVTENTRKLISEARKGQPSAFKGKSHTPEVIDKLRDINSNRSDDWKNKIKEGLKKSQSEANRKGWANLTPEQRKLRCENISKGKRKKSGD